MELTLKNLNVLDRNFVISKDVNPKDQSEWMKPHPKCSLAAQIKPAMATPFDPDGATPSSVAVSLQ
jgi:hypothetical protein